ncbi:MAG: SpoIIE family protein phosphatase, partial [Desulfamplus sp.]|nr:SpoIIE family protein phosphatase [Desulfamplus sp.]
LRAIIEKYLKEPPNSKDNSDAKNNHRQCQDSNKEEFAESSSQVNEESFDKSCPFKGYSLLLVEENKQLRESYSDFLMQIGFEVNSVSNGSEALKFIEDNNDKILDIVVSNIFTSGIDGLGLLTIIKRQFPHILVFLYTQSYDPSTFQFAVQQKVDGIIPQAQITKNNAIEIIESALSQLMLKGSRLSDAKTVSLVRQAQSQLFRAGCINLCQLVDFTYQPLHEAGGDLMRCHRFGLDGDCGLVIADVSGHDVISSYTSATFTGILTSFWDSHKDPISLLKKINKELIKVGNDKSHVCATVIVWERLSGKLKLASAGNPGGLLVSFNLNTKPTYNILNGGGMVLGILDDDDLFVYESENLEPNSYLFLFSDGIEVKELIDAIESSSEFFSKNTIKGICQHILDNILDKKEQDDDLLLICIHNPEKNGKPTFHAEFLSTYNEVDRACRWIEDILPIEKIPQGNDKDIVLLSVREAMLNAVEHGNNYKPTSHFEVDLYLKNDELKIVISDEGSGFDLKKNVRKPTDLTLTQIGKRGLTLMTSVGQELIVDGNAVTLTFKTN